VLPQHPLQLALAEREVAATQLDCPVGVEQKQLAGQEAHIALLETRLLDHADQRSRNLDPLDAAVGAHEQRRRMTARVVAQRRRVQGVGGSAP
jgi:hypothetical protein